MTAIRNFISVVSLAVMLSVGFVALAPAEETHACIGEAAGQPGFFEFPTWHKYLNCPGGNIELGTIEGVNEEQGGLPDINQLWLIGVAVLEIILSLGGLVAFGFVIWGGYGYISSQGQPDKAATARKTIINALIGMTIVVMSTIVVQFTIRLLTGGNGTDSGGAISIPNPGTGAGTLARVLTFVYGLAAAIAVINIVIAGIKFMLSAGDSSKAANARNTIIYAAVGLVIVLSASIITNTILDRI